MITIRTLEQPEKRIRNECVVTLGNFDGIHRGHQALLDRVLAVSRETGLSSCVVTYDPNPAVVLGKNPELKSLMSLSDKTDWIAARGIDYLVILPFDRLLAEMSAESFLENILLRDLKAKKIVIGFNHCFGKGRRGNYDLLLEYSEKLNYSVEKVDPVYLGEVKLSSSYLRGLIAEGKIVEAETCLGRRYSVEGAVVSGHKRGRTIGFPTANVKTDSDLLLPGIGVYAGTTTVDGVEYPSMINVGRNPTFGENPLTLESHIFDFQNDIYGKTVRITFTERIRNEAKFEGIEALVAQLKNDETQSRRILKKLGAPS
ncbi:bifunctional riboflavin kinase/FAD synthetase [Leptospira gomenensis]|uniref:Riboflavin biosynthesis protein n=1 Tax=Leptospira gomenensis TaxID=2484974 RepID=A0A5F1YBJ9_9LEPT|nr:bifunctional riboflavin kinase/FAD synthetase [Leptospira gomenensis]TGK32413.1 bifunctional riboflavin kinase/FAD synthetase [Leptospira gomenensis]TGK34690.1 bifunctional riboflavin kinase/FAD synthetase [Leptospira gomenensis]TGK51013.1 bifunctional riboflavin kinase/FAD synthetase [Leptospira gomenensis]TGK68346.1 bifunctional riboflavin kinase/FAD synthetase [Leptospira gomenensis]